MNLVDESKFLMYFSYYAYVAEATPKRLMRVMEIPGLTLEHLKSHLQVS